MGDGPTQTVWEKGDEGGRRDERAVREEEGGRAPGSTMPADLNGGRRLARHDRQAWETERYRLGLQRQPQGLLGGDAALVLNGDDTLDAEGRGDGEQAARPARRLCGGE